MGEQAHLPLEKKAAKQHGNSGDQEMPSDSENEEDFDDISQEGNVNFRNY